MRSLALVSTFLCGAFGQAQSLGNQPIPQHRLIYRSVTGVRVNPLMLLQDVKLTYRHRLYQSERQAFADNFIGIGLSAAATPACAFEGIHFEFAPAAFITLTANADVWQWFGGFNYIQSWPYADDNWGPNENARLALLPEGAPGRNYPTFGFSLTGGVILQGKVGPVVMRSHNRLFWVSLKLRDGDTIFYDAISDLAAPNRGFTVSSDNDVAVTMGRLIVGLRFGLNQAVYRPTDFSPGAVDPNVPSIRLGPTAAWRFFAEPTHRFNPAVALTVAWFLSHRFRTGLDVSQALPQVTLSFSFWGDVLETATPAVRSM
jgi:hypothetical protein